MSILLSQAELDFLVRLGVDADDLFDATGMKKKEYRPKMKELDLMFATGVTPCNAYGHRIRNRYGNCVQCNPGTTSYANRYHVAGDVYVAHSEVGQLVKVGMSNDLGDRMQQLNVHRPGGFSDWKLLASVYVENARRVENALQVRLHEYQADYAHFARDSYCKELFTCSPSLALQAFRFVARELGGA
jgi:hypothetical protein